MDFNTLIQRRYSCRAFSASPVEREKIDFHLTRPFLYAIESRDGTVLFLGTVAEPVQE